MKAATAFRCGINFFIDFIPILHIHILRMWRPLNDWKLYLSSILYQTFSAQPSCLPPTKEMVPVFAFIGMGADVLEMMAVNISLRWCGPEERV
jgi:hypothetical protein